MTRMQTGTKPAARGEIAFDMMATIQSSGDTNCLLIILQKVFLHQRDPIISKKKKSLVRDPAQSTVCRLYSVEP